MNVINVCFYLISYGEEYEYFFIRNISRNYVLMFKILLKLFIWNFYIFS